MQTLEPRPSLTISETIQRNSTKKIQAQGRKRVLIAAGILQRRIRSMLEGRAVRRRYLALHKASLALQRWGRTRSQRSHYIRQKMVSGKTLRGRNVRVPPFDA